MISVRYAKALYQLATEKNILKDVYNDMQGVIAVLKSDNSLKEFLENPVVKEEQKKQLLVTAFGDRVQPIILSMFKLLVDNNREHFLNAVCLSFLQIYKEKQGFREVILTTAKPATEDSKSQLQKELSEKLHTKVAMQTIVDEKLIGGFKLRVDDLLMDKSIATQLENIKKELLSK